MPYERLLGNPKSAETRRVAGLKQKTVRNDTGRFLVEGPQSVREALQWQPDAVEVVYITDEADYKWPELTELAGTTGVEAVGATIPVLNAMADTTTPQGVVAVVKQRPVSHRALFDEVGEDGPRKLVVILEDVRDPGNAGTILRAADAVGADAVVFAGRSVDVYNPKVVRSTTGSIFHVPVVVQADLAEVIGEAKAHGVQVFAADAHGEPLPTMRDALAAPTAWVFGNEAQGLSDAARDLADRVVALPIYGKAESLNLATAASVSLYASAFSQHAQ